MELQLLTRKELAIIGNVDSQNLSIIDLKINEVIETIQIGTAPLGLTPDPSGEKVFITSWFKNQVTCFIN